MEILSVSFPKQVSLSNIVKARYSSGRIALPVQRNQSMYAHFKHVNGFPAPEKDQGITLAKLRNLDQLIDRIKKLKSEQSSGNKRTGLSEFALDALIDKYSKELQAAAAVQTAHPFNSLPVETGLLVDAVA